MWSRAGYGWECGDSGELWCRTDAGGGCQGGGETALTAEVMDRTDKWGQAGVFMDSNVCGQGDAREAEKLVRRRRSTWMKSKKEWKSYSEWRVTNLGPCEVWRKAMQRCRHRWDSPSATVSLLPGNTAISLNAPSPEPVHHQARQREHKTVIRSQRRETLQSALIRASRDCELWPSSTGSDHAKERNWLQGNQLVVVLKSTY